MEHRDQKLIFELPYKTIREDSLDGRTISRQKYYRHGCCK
ncbi:hypothetical protein FHR92_004010 [Fontibacillus solani]|uniref:Uncharacterized protein n=1 Tax=Fontibacillus solani TaxID=1572857 RepID=A0A7W3SWH5_9BACL|nr:hypothetical protein [Fontibacillus solani]